MENDTFTEESRSPRNNCQLPNAFNRVKPIDNCSTDLINQRIDHVLRETRDLRDEQFTAWHAAQARRLGVDRYLGLASDARKGRSPAKYFSYLLRNA